MRRKRSRLALLGILALAFSVTAGLTLGGAAEAKKKKKGGGGGTKTITKAGGVVPDAFFSTFPPSGNGGEFHQGLLASSIVVGRKFASAKIKDLNVEVTATHPDIGDLFIQLVGPNGQLINLFDGTDNNPPGTGAGASAGAFGPPFFSGGRLGPTVFDDTALLYINDTRSATDAPPNALFGTEAFAPYLGSYKPQDGTLASLGSRLMGRWILLVFDFDAFTGPGDEPAATGTLVNWKLIAQLKGGGKKKKKKK